ncbi:MAG: hypoxanthine-guanine phosphoribosyltransferase [Gammaproteobacteria bacterium]
MSVPPSVLAARTTAELLFDAETVLKAIDQLAVRLTVELADENPLLISVLNGGLAFTGALMQRLVFPLELTCLHVGRYGRDTRGGELIWHARPDVPVADRHVVFVDDILDHGVTLASLAAWAREERARSVTTVVLVDKTIEGERPIEPDYAALVCPDRYLFGWGMDFEGYWRNLTAIYALAPDAEEGS